MVENGPTYNLVKEELERKLGLRIKLENYSFKAINFEDMPMIFSD